MAESCTTQAISLGFPKTVEGLGVSVEGSTYPNSCEILTANPCFPGGKTLYLSLGETKLVTCAVGLSEYWQVTYDSYLSEYAVKLKVCRVTEDAVDPPPEPDPEADVDYELINAGTQGIVDDGVAEVEVKLNENNEGIQTVSGKVDALGTALTTLIASGFEGIGTGLSDMKDSIIEGVEGALGGVTSGLADLGDKIDSLRFPTLDGIKGAFLDVCADLAAALWDAILDRIEERYAETEEEAD